MQRSTIYPFQMFNSSLRRQVAVMIAFLFPVILHEMKKFYQIYDQSYFVPNLAHVSTTAGSTNNLNAVFVVLLP